MNPERKAEIPCPYEVRTYKLSVLYVIDHKVTFKFVPQKLPLMKQADILSPASYH
jgi:hypothetical protein